MKYTNAAVTGSTGFIGSHLTAKLREKGINIFEISRSSSQIDITSWDQVKNIPAQDVLFHLAGVTNISLSFENPHHVYINNVVGTLNMLEWCRKNEVTKMVYLSTFVYGIPQYLPLDEKHPATPTNPYSTSKLLAEELCQAYCRDYGLNVAILRLFNVYGPGQKPDFVIPRVIEQFPSGKVQLGASTPRRDFVYVDDVVDSIVSASISEIRGFEIFNIASGISYSIKEIASELSSLYSEETGNQVSINYSDVLKKGDVLDTVANIEKSKIILNWYPKIDIKTGLFKTLRAYLDEHKG
ncbi:NAD-dependent epimerase/dehydratase family protein [uncultured Methanomethylovorans sp.]|uniref:NAD-dependent epimerase/dehydratase family protein n=1 Tax=uncultured Methanomethylovorans sp. TaxID=183759 RepID=UPI002AA86633|nr:NAD-dependent epimerase/dehydratase family protein [uncultured Methanomethylovorans sp.]